MNLSEKQALFLEALFGEAKGDFKEAKKAAGYSAGTPVSAIVGPIKEKIRELTKEHIEISAVRAAFAMEQFLDEKTLPTIGDKERFGAAKDLLDRGGFKPTEKYEVEAPNPLVFLPEKK